MWSRAKTVSPAPVWQCQRPQFNLGYIGYGDAAQRPPAPERAVPSWLSHARLHRRCLRCTSRVEWPACLPRHHLIESGPSCSKGERPDADEDDGEDRTNDALVVSGAERTYSPGSVVFKQPGSAPLVSSKAFALHEPWNHSVSSHAWCYASLSRAASLLGLPTRIKGWAHSS